jgi:hypothetical protein
MVAPVINVQPRRDNSVEGTIGFANGHLLMAKGEFRAPQDQWTFKGRLPYKSNMALKTYLWALCQTETERRRAKNKTKKSGFEKHANENLNSVKTLTDYISRQSNETVEGYCSFCMEYSTHAFVKRPSRRRIYICRNCGNPGSRCPVVKCQNLARYPIVPTPFKEVIKGVSLFHCAEHDHTIPAFDTVWDDFDEITDCEEWLRFSKPNMAKYSKVTAGVAAGVVLVAPLALISAPAVGGAIGVLKGLSGAAATSHGLAVLGGGSLAAGGLGMAGGTAVITATGGALGGVLGATTATAYARHDKDFKIKKVKEGAGPSVLFTNGFLTKDQDHKIEWDAILSTKYSENPWYRVQWDSSTRKALGVYMGLGPAKGAAIGAVGGMAKQATKTAVKKVPGLWGPLAAHGLATNPWFVAKCQASMTAAILADFIARTNDQFILVGHSLGAKVMGEAAMALGKGDGFPEYKIKEMHLLGAALDKKADWYSIENAVEDTVYNYYSRHDPVLKFFKLANGNSGAVGLEGVNGAYPKIVDVNASRYVRGHREYFTNIQLC